MNEKAAITAIKQGSVTIGDIEFLIIKQPQGSCEDCYFDQVIRGKHINCPKTALDICCTGGYILKKQK